jgi:hypothetical protein
MQKPRNYLELIIPVPWSAKPIIVTSHGLTTTILTILMAFGVIPIVLHFSK